MVNWDDYYQEFILLSAGDGECIRREHPSFRTLVTKLHALGESLASGASPEDVEWLAKALGEGGKKYFATYPIDGMGDAVPERLFLPLMEAALHEPDPSFNAYFVVPCIRSFGPRRVNEHLLDVFESGSNLEKARAVNALYHAQSSGAILQRTVNGIDIRQKGEARSLTRFSELEDIWCRKRRLFLAEFLRNEDLDFKKFMVPRMSWSPNHYKEEELHLLEEATSLAVSLGLFV